MPSRFCDSLGPLRRRCGLEGPVSPVATGDKDHSGDTNLPAISIRSPMSPVSPVARTREGFRSTAPCDASGSSESAHVNFSEPSGGGGDTGDTSTGPPCGALDRSWRHGAVHVGFGGQRLMSASRPSTGTGGAPSREPGAATTMGSAADQLRALASRVRRLGLAGRFDPETAFIERDELAHALRQLAGRLDRGADQLLPAPQPAMSRVLLPRRFAAVLAAKTSEIACMRALLAQSMRPPRRRRRSVCKAQLLLPLSEAADDC